MITAAVAFQIPFHDVDILRVAWHGHYYKYFELARTALMRQVGLDWPALEALGIAMPVIRSQAEYRKPIVYGANISIKASVEEWGYPELIVRYTIEDAATAELLAAGETQQIYFDISARQTCFEVPPPVAAAFVAAAEGQLR